MRKTVRCPASVAAVRKNHRRRMSIDRLLAEADERRAVPLHRRLVSEPLRPGDEAGRPVADAARQALTGKSDGEPRDDRDEDDEADHRHELEGAVPAAFGDDAGNGDDRKAEDHELVPDAGDDDREPDRAGR